MFSRFGFTVKFYSWIGLIFRRAGAFSVFDGRPYPWRSETKRCRLAVAGAHRPLYIGAFSCLTHNIHIQYGPCKIDGRVDGGVAVPGLDMAFVNLNCAQPHTIP